jgi:hypothetical protein
MVTDSRPLSYWDFIKAAFWLKVSIPAMGAVPANILALAGFGLIGLGLPPLLLVGLGLEIAYLTTLAGDRRFQNLVRGKNIALEQDVWNQRRDKILSGLGAIARKRHIELITQSLSITLNDENPASALVRGNLAGLLWTHLRLLASQEKVNSIRQLVDRKKSLEEVSDLEKRVAGALAESALYRSLDASLALAKKRITNLDRAEDSAKVLDAEIERIERQITLLREETTVGQNPEMITGHLDSVTRSMEDTGRWLNENADILGDFSLPPSAAMPTSVSLPTANSLTPGRNKVSEK